ncbi:hypothetical protein EDB80DRAFT_623539 [Ilyonectria destructans]|nr:hypothetical protein EDB80DRAFT_623539 [Ilyonectria destructans]
MGDRTHLPQAHQVKQDWQSRVPCRFFAQGQCRSGQKCLYSHATRSQRDMQVESTSQSPSQSSSSTPQRDSRSKVSGRFFLRGTYLKGDTCPFAHTGSNQVLPTEAHATLNDQTATTDNEEVRPEHCQREIGGAWVKFGHGTVVTKVSLPSDFSAARINHLPRDTNPAFVVGLLSKLGFDVSTECVRIPPRGDNSDCSADVRVEDAQFARRLCHSMKNHGGYQVTSINAPNPQASNSRRVDAKKVYCSWHKPSRTAWLNFGNADIATKVASSFSAGIFKILGQRISCEGPTRGAGPRNPLAWTVRVSDVPEHAEISLITRDIPTALQPRHVELSNPTYLTDLPLANTSIESLLLQAGPLERWEGSSETSGKRFKAKTRFVNDADARQAAKLFNNTPLPFNKNDKLTLQLVHSARLKVSTLVYNAVEGEINRHKQAWTSQHLLYAAYAPDHGFRVLKIEGEVSGDVARAKSTIENFLRGELMAVDGKAIWADSFAGNGHASQRIKTIERDLGIVMVRDKRRCQLRVVGDRSRYEEAKRALTELAREDSSGVFVIELNAEKLSWAFKGGFRAVSAAIGSEKVTLGIVSNPRRLLVTGSEADFQIARDILQSGKGVPLTTTVSEAISSEDCAICWTEAENRVHTSCKHCYCSGCFEDLCLAGTSTLDPDAGIRCQGGEGKCGQSLPLEDLQEHLSSAALEDVLEVAFASYVARHPNELRHCPTPDCEQVYRAAKPLEPEDSPVLFTYPACLVAICTACHVPHDGLTCAEHRDHGAGGYEALQKAKQKFGIKDCPKCGTMIEKSSGCNQMTCSVCKAHICWVCMRTFSEGGLVYSHMGREHGGIGVEYYPNLM